MRLLSRLVAVAALAFGVASASPQEPKLVGKFETATVITSCHQMVAVIITTDSDRVYVVDRNSGIPADALKAAIQASGAEVRVYEVGCELPTPEIRT